MESKICIQCGLLKSLDDYNFEPRNKDGHGGNCKLCKAKVDKDYKNRNKEKVKAKLHKYYLEHSDDFKEVAKLWQTNNPEKAKEVAEKSRKKHPENQRRATKKWRLAHPERHAEFQRNRNARKRGATGTITRQEFQDLCIQYDFRCLRCGANGKRPDVELTIDHVIPITKGGENSIGNAQPLCRSCNSSKHTQTTDYRFGLGGI